jgi:hypothetical protein
MRFLVNPIIRAAAATFSALMMLICLAVAYYFPPTLSFPWSLKWWHVVPLEVWGLTQALLVTDGFVNALVNDYRVQRAEGFWKLFVMRQPRTNLLPLLETLQAHPRQCERARDHLFALLGISPRAHGKAFYPDYTEPFDKIVLRYARGLLDLGLIFPLLRRASVVPLSSRFPSWAPDWTAGFSDPLEGFQELNSRKRRLLGYFLGSSNFTTAPVRIGRPWFVNPSDADGGFAYPTKPPISPSGVGCDLLPDGLRMQGSVCGRVSQISDFKQWQKFRDHYAKRMSRPLVFFNTLFIPTLLFLLVFKWMPYLWLLIFAELWISLTIARAVADCTIINPFYIWIPPSQTASPKISLSWRSKIVRCWYKFGDWLLWIGDFTVFVLTRTEPLRWQLAGVFNRFPGHQQRSLWSFWSLFPRNKMWLGSLWNVRLGFLNERHPCFIFSDSVIVGDLVCLLKGCRVPFVLRESVERPGWFRLVGECYTESFITRNDVKTEELETLFLLH